MRGGFETRPYAPDRPAGRYTPANSLSRRSCVRSPVRIGPSHQERGGRRAAHHLVGHAAQQRPLHSPASARRHHHQCVPGAFRQFNHRVRRILPGVHRLHIGKPELGFDCFGLVPQIFPRQRGHAGGHFRRAAEMEPAFAVQSRPLGMRAEVVRVVGAAHQDELGAAGSRQFASVGQRVLGKGGAVQRHDYVVQRLADRRAAPAPAPHYQRRVADAAHYPAGYTAHHQTGEAAPAVG